jgi:hypothetical protein
MLQSGAALSELLAVAPNESTGSCSFTVTYISSQELRPWTEFLGLVGVKGMDADTVRLLYDHVVVTYDCPDCAGGYIGRTPSNMVRQ